MRNFYDPSDSLPPPGSYAEPVLPGQVEIHIFQKMSYVFTQKLFFSSHQLCFEPSWTGKNQFLDKTLTPPACRKESEWSL